jgi:hypothetical protein
MQAEPKGTRIRVTDASVKGGGLEIGGEYVWGDDPHAPGPLSGGHVWFQEMNVDDGHYQSKPFGWIRYEVVKPRAQAPTAVQLAELIQAFAAIGPNARTLLLNLAQRLVKGAKEHGDFDPSTKRVWTREALEEDLDGIVYRALELQERIEQ